MGVDIVDLDRFTKAVERWGDHFLNRILTPQEIAYCRRKASGIESMAVRFAAKEAFIKCLSEEEYRSFHWQDVCVENAQNGKPHLLLRGELQQIFSDHQIVVTLSHSRLSAVAVVLIEQGG
jgi:holo-[acyl-carrier protein] synthase